MSLLRQTVVEWWEDDSLRLGAALSYYTLFSLAPLLVVAVAVAGLVFGEEAASGRVVAEMRGLVGADGAAAIQTMIEKAAWRPGNSRLAAVIGLGTILVGASGAFGQLQYALNEIWDVEAPKHAGYLALLRTRLLSFSMVLVVGFLLLVALVFSAAISALDEVTSGWAETLQPLVAVLELAGSFGMITLLFAAMFKLLPDAEIRWADVWVGAAVTSLLFVLGKAAIGLYLGNSSVASVYGAASSLAVILIWVYYSSQILFLGAEFTQVYSRQRQGADREKA